MEEYTAKKEALSPWSIIIIVLFLWGFVLFLPTLYNTMAHCEAFGPAQNAKTGDMFGLANSLFSSLAFAFLAYQSYLQQQELTLQRKSLSNQEAEIKLTMLAQESTENARREQFETQLLATKLTAVNDQISREQKLLSELDKLADLGPWITIETKITGLLGKQSRLLRALERETNVELATPTQTIDQQ
ncbi:MAG: hypothetical protein JRG71_01850 [Deltaproteobacteria bacterium]|nr:hypothetical protein [Deltaproteobacteria bacterium]